MFEELFKRLLEAEQVEREANSALREATNLLGVKACEAETEVKQVWVEIKEAMKKVGVDRVKLRGEDNTDFLISYSKPREIVDVPDVDILPERFVRMKKEPDKKALAEFLKACHETNNPLPNYATLTLSEPKLGWKPVKRGDV